MFRNIRRSVKSAAKKKKHLYAVRIRGAKIRCRMISNKHEKANEIKTKHNFQIVKYFRGQLNFQIGEKFSEIFDYSCGVYFAGVFLWCV